MPSFKNTDSNLKLSTADFLEYLAPYINTNTFSLNQSPQLSQLLEQSIEALKALNFEFSFIQPNFGEAQKHLQKWLMEENHGDMAYLKEHAHIRAAPESLLEAYQSMLIIRVPYIYQNNHTSKALNSTWLKQAWAEITTQPTISWYARGRDYHKVLKQNLKKIANALQNLCQNQGYDLNYRVFSDTMPIMEVEAATQGGLGWRGKHGLLIHPKQGSLFFLGGILFDQNVSFFENLFKQISKPNQNSHLDTIPISLTPTHIQSHCGSCQKCIDICPTKAIIKPYVLDARRCISYLTIEYQGSIDLELRRSIGLHLYGCDECQLICPWNKFATRSQHLDFQTRPYPSNLFSFWEWLEDDFLKHTAGSSMRRINFWQFQRNLAIISGNFLRQLAEKAQKSKDITEMDLLNSTAKQLKNILQQKIKNIPSSDEILIEHLTWALSQYE